jgi:hypothetical protein
MIAQTASPPLVHRVPMTYPAAIQAIAAIDERVLHLRAIGAEAWAIADCHAAATALRMAFDVWPPTEAQLDAAHEASQAEIRELADADDIPLALDSYWNRGA